MFDPPKKRTFKFDQKQLFHASYLKQNEATCIYFLNGWIEVLLQTQSYDYTLHFTGVKNRAGFKLTSLL